MKGKLLACCAALILAGCAHRHACDAICSAKELDRIQRGIDAATPKPDA